MPSLRQSCSAWVLSALAVAGCATEPEVEPAGALAPEIAVEPTPESAQAAEPAQAVEVAPAKWAELKAEIRGKFPDVAQLTVGELEDWLAEEREAPLLLDVREPEEFAVSHLAGARLAADEDAALRALGDAPLDRPVVLYCSVGYRSSALAEKLAARGYTELFNLEGSIFEWANQGQPVVRADEPVREVHPYDSEWGLLLRRDYWSPLDGR